jgi:iron complex outermembrane receptor protein
MKSAFRRQLLASTLLVGAVGLSTPLAAQVAGQPVETTPEATESEPQNTLQSQATPTADDTGDVVVTGSRIRRDNFTTPSVVNVITRNDSVLAGSRSTADILQGSTVTSGTSQINGSYLGFVSEGGPAASTVGLRGLSSSRTLVLLNGRRLAPAGVGPQLVAADLNVLPTSVVQRVEVLREGASSVYGSDAIAGVINVITDSKVNGVTLDAFTDQPVQHGGGGRNYRLSGTAGHVFERGHLTGSFEYRQTTGMRVGDRKAFSCPRDLFTNAVGEEVGQRDPATGQLQCFPYTTGGGSGIASGYGVAQSFYGFPASRFTYANGNINNIAAVNGIDRVGPSPQQLQDHIISPVKTYTGYLNGSYELGLLGDAEIYGEALFTRRKSHQDFTRQISIDRTVGVLSPNIQIYGGDYDGTPLSAYGYPTSPFYPNAVANAGYQIYTPFIVPNREARSSQKVDYFRANGGLRGSFGVGDWKYDANFQYSRTRSRSAISQTTTTRFSNVLQAVLAPAGTPDNLVTVALPGQAGAGGRYTCASNVSNGALIAGASCVPLNLYDPAVVLNGAIPDNVYNYLYQDDVGRTTFNQSTISLNADGTLFNLPAGPVRVAVGYERRHDFINDVPSADAQAAVLYNYSSSGITKGKDLVNEVYGEIGVPILKDRPFFQNLEVSASGRYTHYKSYGSDFTYHFNGQWAPADFIRFRGNYGTSFRAPNLYEQFVADQTGFYGGNVDPCTGFIALPTTSNVYKNCLAQLTPILGANAINYIATSGPQVTTRGGAGELKAEHSTSYGFGAVLTAPRHVADLSFAIDYFNISVKDEVTTLGNLILNRCYEADDFGPGNQYCALIDPRRPASDPQPGSLASFLNPYLNVSEQRASGIDFDLRYGTGLFGGKFLFKAQATRNLHQYYQLFAADEPTDYNGTLGVQGFGAGPKWVGSAEVRYTFPGDAISFRYGVQYVGPQDSTDSVDPELSPAPFLGVIGYDLKAEKYFNHGASVQFRVEEMGQITMGVNNLFNKLPPRISSFPTSDGQFTRVGNYFNSSNYDLIGRSFFINVTRTF